LNRSLAQSAADLWLAKVWSETANVTFCVTFLFLAKFGFLSHNLGFKYARKPIKGSKDADFSLVSKTNLEPKMGCWIGAQGQAKLAKKSKTPRFWRHSQRTPNPKLKNNFSTETRRLP